MTHFVLDKKSTEEKRKHTSAERSRERPAKMSTRAHGAIQHDRQIKTTQTRRTPSKLLASTFWFGRIIRAKIAQNLIQIWSKMRKLPRFASHVSSNSPFFTLRLVQKIALSHESAVRNPKKVGWRECWNSPPPGGLWANGFQS